MTEFILRPARPEDAAAVAEVNITTWRDAYAGLLPEEVINTRKLTPERIDIWQKRIANAAFFYVAETSAGQIVAMAWGAPTDSNDETPWPYQLHALYVLPRYQKRDIGRQLMEKFSAYTGGTPFYLYMLAGNRAAAFYRQTGGIRRPEYDRTHQWQGIETKLELFLFNG